MVYKLNGLVKIVEVLKWHFALASCQASDRARNTHQQLADFIT